MVEEVLAWLSRFKWFVFGPADVNATRSCILKSRMVYLSGAGIPKLSQKRGR